MCHLMLVGLNFFGHLGLKFDFTVTISYYRFLITDFLLPISYYQFRKLDTLRSISQRRFQSENGTFPSGIALEKLEVRNCN